MPRLLGSRCLLVAQDQAQDARERRPISSASSRTSCRRRTGRSGSPTSRAYCRPTRRSARSPSPTAKASGCASPTRASSGRARRCCSARLDIDTLAADQIDVLRQPLPEEGLPAPEAGGVPDSGTAAVGHARRARRAARHLRRRRFRARIRDRRQRPSAAGRRLARYGLNVGRLDGPGGQAGADRDLCQLLARTQSRFVAVEPADGIVANLLGIDGRPPMALALKGAGPLDDAQLGTDARCRPSVC